MMEEHPFFAHAYVVIAAIAGAITALALAPWRRLTVAERMLTLVVGFSFAVFVTPLVAVRFGIGVNNAQALAGLTYLFGSGSNILLPRVIRWVSGKAFGIPDDGKKAPGDGV